jgi:aminopeptidase N
VLSVTEDEARKRAELLTDIAYDVFLDLAATPARSRTRATFRCRRPGAETFAQLGLATAGEIRLNGQPLPPPDGERVRLTGLAAANVLIAEGTIGDVGGMDPGLIRFTDPADGAGYVIADGYPDEAARLFCCFDQPSLPCALTLSVRVPPGWRCLGNGEARADGEGLWHFGTVTGMRPHLLTVCAGPYHQVWAGSAGHGVPVRVWRRASLPDQDEALERFGGLAARAIGHYESTLGTPCPYPGYDIVFAPELTALAGTVPGLMSVSETLLSRMADPDDDLVTTVCAHEVAHLWFGCHVTMRWWDDLWLDEALATYLSAEFTGGWAAFAYRDKARAYRADELPGRLPVSSPVASSALALSRPDALTYAKGAAVIRQLGALIGADALRTGMREYLGRFAGSCGTLADLVACWSRASGRDLAGWADTWLRSDGAPALLGSLAAGRRHEVTDHETAGSETAGPEAAAGGLLVITQDPPRPQLIRIGLYDRAPAGRGLRRRELIEAELAGAALAGAELAGGRTVVPVPPGQAVAAAVVANDGDLGYARLAFDERSWQALADAALELDDPVTEAVCWNAAWQLVTGGRLAAAAFAGLVTRRLADGQAGLPAAGAEVLLDRAVSCADSYAPADLRAGLREQLAECALDAARRAAPGSPAQRTLAAAFAASAHRDDQLGLLAAWLDGSGLPGGLTLDADLRARVLSALSAGWLARQSDIDALPGLDPASGEIHRATCLAMRPDPAAKEEAWTAVLSGVADGRLAEASALGLWVAGQEQLMAGYRDRYFGEALDALAGMGSWAQERLGRLLFPSTLRDAATEQAAQAVLAGRDLPADLRSAVAEQAAVTREVMAARRSGVTRAS